MNEKVFHLPSETKIGSVHLRVSNLDRSLQFYRDLLGLREGLRLETTARLSASGEEANHLVLTELPGAKPKPRRSTGLYHVAIRFPDRHALAGTLAHLLEKNYPLQGGADHGVSEALYLGDPDGIGLELYTDRPRNEWPMQGSEVAMVSEELDMRSLLDDLDSSTPDWNVVHSKTDIGHVHLQVSSLDKARNFYCNILGFEVTQSSYPGALFVSAGGYHHHIGLNVWTSLGASRSPTDAVGLISFNITTQGRPLTPLISHLTSLNYPFAMQGGVKDKPGLRLHDQDGIVVDITE